MKKLLFTALIAISLTSSAFASSTKEVGYHIANSFATSFPKASLVQWKITADYTKASFVLNNVNTEAFYNRNGDLIATSYAVTIDEMPTNVKRSLAKKYSDYTVKEAIKFDGVEETAYFISAENDKGAIILKVTGGYIQVIKH